MTDDDFEKLAAGVAAELRRRAQTVHERVACPKCGAGVGVRCWHMGYRRVPHNVSRSTLKHPHRERLRADGIAER